MIGPATAGCCPPGDTIGVQRLMNRIGGGQTSTAGPESLKDVRDDLGGRGMHLLLVRHCQSSGQAPDAPLTPLGQQQADQLADLLQARGIARIVSSPYTRAVQT